MTEPDRQRELMDELRRRFQDSSLAMRRIAQRIHAAADASRAVERRARRAAEPLARDLGAEPSPVCFSYIEYLEFSGADEFERFRHAPPVGDADLARLDWDELERRLLA